MKISILWKSQHALALSSIHYTLCCIGIADIEALKKLDRMNGIRSQQEVGQPQQCPKTKFWMGFNPSKKIICTLFPLNTKYRREWILYCLASLDLN